MHSLTESTPFSASAGCVWGSFIGDALAMPVHWYYDREALRRDYGVVRDYLAPRNPHADSILWRSEYVPLNPRGDILREQTRFWGQRGIHYHQFLRAGENTLNLQLALELAEMLASRGSYDSHEYLERYVAFMLSPGKHRDTYVEEYHRKFFTNYARGLHPSRCGGSDIHIGGLAHVGVLCGFLGTDRNATVAAVREHIGLTHQSDEVLAAGAAMAQMLCDVIAGADLRDAIWSHGSDWFSRRKAEAWSKEPDEVVIGKRVSSACYIADAFPAVLYLAWKYASDFESGVVANTNVGGDNCHRGAVLGALLGANAARIAGKNGIPERYFTGLQHAMTLDRLPLPCTDFRGK